MIRLLLTAVCFLLFVILTLPLLLFELILRCIDPEKSELQSQAIVRFLMKMILWISGAEVDVRGLENIPEGEPVLFVPNHRSYFDFVITFTKIGKPFINIGKKELSAIPLIGLWVKLIGTLLIDRSSRKQGYQIIEQAAEKIRTGHSFLIYPEGTRNRGKIEEPLRFREGSLKISVWAGCKVLPFALINTRSIYEKHRPWIRPCRVLMIVGEPMDPKLLTEEEQKKFGAMVRDRIIGMIRTNGGEEENG